MKKTSINLAKKVATRMPAEWEKQEAIWLAWPHNKKDWPGKFEPILWVYAEIIRYISLKQEVRLIVKDASEKVQATKILKAAHANLAKISFINIPTDRIWVRDSAPTFVYQGKKRMLLDWHFNAWAKYSNWKKDNKISSYISSYLGLPIIKPTININGIERHVVLEGGAIEVNGKGTLITTEECLLSKIQCRNPGFNRKDYERIFEQYLGVSHVIWLKRGIVGDDTHGHIDDLARFLSSNTVVIAVEKDKADKNYLVLKENFKRLKAARDQRGKALNVVELPMPKAVMFKGQRLPASYANFLITNDFVLIPVFNDPNDRIVLDIFSKLFPNRCVTGIYCGDFVWGLGTIHCASQQEIKSFSKLQTIMN